MRLSRPQALYLLISGTSAFLFASLICLAVGSSDDVVGEAHTRQQPSQIVWRWKDSLSGGAVGLGIFTTLVAFACGVGGCIAISLDNRRLMFLYFSTCLLWAFFLLITFSLVIRDINEISDEVASCNEEEAGNDNECVGFKPSSWVASATFTFFSFLFECVCAVLVFFHWKSGGMGVEPITAGVAGSHSYDYV